MARRLTATWLVRGAALAVILGSGAYTVAAVTSPTAQVAAAATTAATTTAATTTQSAAAAAAEPTTTLTHVTLTVDGEAQSIDTAGTTVADALADAGITVTARDLLAPDASAPLTDGQQITLDRARPLTLTVDGQTRAVWVTGTTVDEALASLNVRADGAYVSASRSTRIPLDGLTVALRLPHRVSVRVDNRTTVTHTTAATVADVLTELHVTLGANDIVTPPLTAYPVNGAHLVITRVASTTATENDGIAFDTKRIDDATMLLGTTRVVTDGVKGVRHKVWRLQLRNGKVVKKTLVSDTVTTKPVTRVIAVGTRKPVVHTSDNAYPTYGGLNWHALAHCESGNDPHSHDGPYHGLYQFLLSTWQSVGGTGDPADATIHEQTYRAWLLYQRDGRHPWPVCGKYL